MIKSRTLRIVPRVSSGCAALVTLTLLATLASPVKANDANNVKGTKPTHPCKVMMAKLAVQYDQQRLNVERDTSGFWTLDRTAESMTGGAYGLSRDELQEKWPGLWDYAYATSLDGLKKKVPVSDFESRAFQGCMRRWG